MALTKLTGLPSVRSALLCSALTVPAMVPVAAFAQDQAETCMQLEQAAAEIDFEESEISQDEFDQVVQSNDAAQCETWLTQVRAESGVEGEVTDTERARVRLEDEVVIEGRVIVDQQQPQIQVEEQAAEVTVGRTTPDVNVSQGPIDIVIRQGAPMITLDMPQPTIRIEQPAPEIIVTMPDPSVDVGNTRPQVEVRQAEPRVQVSMPEPTVELDLYQAEDPENSPGIAVEQRQQQAGTDSAESEPEVTMNRAEAQIIYQDSEQQQANVNHSRSEPSIRFEQAEPEVQISSSGEPQISWAQAGEPTVRFQDSASGEGEQQASGDGNQQTAAQGESDQSETGQTQAEQAQSDQQQTDQAQTDQAQTDQEQAGGPNVRRDGYESVEVQDIETSEMDGATVYGVRGNEVSEIGDLSVEEQAQAIIVDVGAVVESEERRVEIPFSDLTVLRSEDNGDVRVYIDASEERLMNYPEAG